MEGEVLGERYRITRRLGQGGFGTVYEAEHVELGHGVAVKMLDASRQSEESIARFLREAEALTRLTHSCAVKVFDRGRTDDGRLWIAMELLAGETLDVRLARGVLFPADVVQLFRPICELMAEAHAKGIVHRDLKPANVMLLPVAGGGWSPKVFDFGIATLRDDDRLTHPDLVSGTPRYMAPEQWEGLAHADARSDIYSLGVIAYECVSGAVPLEADGALAWANKHRYQEPRDIADAMAGRPLPRGMRDAIMTALAKRPDDRLPTALALWTGLSAGLDAAVAGDDDERRARPSRRRVLRWAVPAIAIPVAAAGGVAWYRQSGSAGAVAGSADCPPLPGSFMPLSLGSWWRYLVIDPISLRAKPERNTLRLDWAGDIGGRKAGVIGMRLARSDAEGTAFRWLAREGEAAVWHRDEWFDLAGALTKSVYYTPWRLRVDDACVHRVVGARWELEYDKIEIRAHDPQAKTVTIREEWSTEAIDDEVTVPAGTFRTIRLLRRRRGDEDSEVSRFWFAAGVGKIKEDSPPAEIEELEAYHLGA